MPVVISGSASYPSPSPGPVVTIGNFDGVHLGHRQLLARAVEVARGAPVCVYTFDPAPRDVLRPGNPIPRIQSLPERIAMLGEAGADQVVIEPFDHAFAAHSAEWFATEVLGRRLGAAAVVVGWDFRFGHGREGTAHKLAEWLSVPVHEVAPFVLPGDTEPVSSSRVRKAVQAGDVGAAALLLGRPHGLLGEVIPGDARGRSLGFPTANVRTRSLLLPANGVYAGLVETEQRKRFFGVVNIGTRPTFDGSDRRIEVHVLDFDGDLYGQELRVELVARLRDERRFESLDALVTQIRADIVAARQVLGST